jgi:hypothetical protein
VNVRAVNCTYQIWMALCLNFVHPVMSNSLYVNQFLEKYITVPTVKVSYPQTMWKKVVTFVHLAENNLLLTKKHVNFLSHAACSHP